MRKWKLEDASNRFSDLIRRAQILGPQLVTKGGRDAVVVISVEDYARLAGTGSLVEFLGHSPLAEALKAGELELDRSPSLGRDVAF